MPRYCRLFVTDIPLHIVQRGHDRQPVFVESADYEYCLSNIAEAKSEFDVQVHAYCLMTNHLHLLVTPGLIASSISSFMRTISARQTRYINKREKRTGTLWDGRFKASPIDSSSYLLACQRYIELNPVRARMVARPGDYQWSSYRQNVGDSDTDWLDVHGELVALGRDARSRCAAYRAFVDHGISDDERQSIRIALNRNQVTGNDRFRETLARRTGRRLSTAGPGRPRK